jgi:hypothetical protein
LSARPPAYVSIRQHTSAYASIRYCRYELWFNRLYFAEKPLREDFYRQQDVQKPKNTRKKHLHYFEKKKMRTTVLCMFFVQLFFFLCKSVLFFCYVVLCMFFFLCKSDGRITHVVLAVLLFFFVSFVFNMLCAVG